jgi:hypothetical protein
MNWGKSIDFWGSVANSFNEILDYMDRYIYLVEMV